MDLPSFEYRIPQGDNRRRQVCTDCGFIHYQNPRVIVGTLATWENRILLCKRAIEPRAGYWTLPAGFLEQNETSETGAIRETLEEAGATVVVESLLALYDVPHVSQVHLYYKARLVNPSVEAGEESLEARLLTWDEIPWRELAFPVTRWALEDYRRIEGRPEFVPFRRSL
jgi:ADP-ribose pyrophosphatase YjhB (NUDIX family)